MATGDYANTDVLKDTLSLSGQSYADADISNSISAASRAIDNMCNRRFYADAEDEVYYFTPSLTDRLMLDPEFDSITSVMVDFNADGTFEQTWAADTEYVAYPLNRATPYRPVQWIKTHPLSARFFPVGYPRTVQITGKAGWGTTPDPIATACGLLATQVVRRIREAPFGVLGFAETAAHIARTDPQLAALVDPYRRVY